VNGTIGLRSKHAVVQSMQSAPQPQPDQLMARPSGPLFVVEDSGLKDLDGNRIPPPSWTKGQLLNVRNRGEYVVTLLGEEDDPPLRPAPSGALRFSNTALCQAFVSAWYARESHDPRAR